jgi:hypothetical protein
VSDVGDVHLFEEPKIGPWLCGVSMDEASQDNARSAARLIGLTRLRFGMKAQNMLH